MDRGSYIPAGPRDPFQKSVAGPVGEGRTWPAKGGRASPAPTSEVKRPGLARPLYFLLLRLLGLPLRDPVLDDLRREALRDGGVLAGLEGERAAPLGHRAERRRVLEHLRDRDLAADDLRARLVRHLAHDGAAAVEVAH